ncbi:MAG: hypothetical protein MZV64_49065 [Ignavibacteriales bacterium]|nr:hypothetical protein [Ignavibacteriales bacterium]
MFAPSVSSELPHCPCHWARRRSFIASADSTPEAARHTPQRFSCNGHCTVLLW